MVILYVENIDGNYKTSHMKQMKENIEKGLKKDYEFLFIDIIPYIK